MYNYVGRMLNLRAAVLVLGCVLSFSAFAVQVVSGSALQSVKYFSLPDNRLGIKLHFTKPVQAPKAYYTKEPQRIWFDFSNVSNRLKESIQDKDLGALRKFIAVEANGKTRILLELKYAVKYSTKLRGNDFTITLKDNKGVARRSSVNSRFSGKRYATSKHALTKVDFRGTKGHGGQLIIGLSDANVGVDVERRGQHVILSFMGTNIPARLRNRYDVKDFGSAVKSIDVKRIGRNAQVDIAMQGDFQHMAYQVDRKFVVDVNRLTSREKAKLAKSVYTGKRISLNFQDIKVRAVLQLLADFTAVNIVVSDSVKGNITLRLKNVPWDQALAIILKTRGLAKRQVGSIMMIAPSKEIAAQEKQELQAQHEVKELIPLVSELIQVNYAEAANIAGLLKAKGSSLLSSRGNVSVDARTNNLWVQDTSDKLEEIRTLVHRLDIPVKQVLIEARIVSVKKEYERELGIRWGVTNPNHQTGTLEGANNLVQNGNPALVPLDQRLNVNLGAINPTGTIGVALARLGKDFLLDLELSAMEKEDRGDVVASPRLLTANQSVAKIESGEEIPYQQSTSSGATSVAFKKAVLSLEVTPQITPDRKIILHLDIHKDTPDKKLEFGNIPAILTKQIQTNVLVDNGETIVLGGIYEQTREHNVQRIPFLGSIPVIGFFFRHKSIINNREELLIFITPKIILEGHA